MLDFPSMARNAANKLGLIRAINLSDKKRGGVTFCFLCRSHTFGSDHGKGGKFQGVRDFTRF
jgi:hypothetical protein